MRIKNAKAFDFIKFNKIACTIFVKSDPENEQERFEKISERIR